MPHTPSAHPSKTLPRVLLAAGLALLLAVPAHADAKEDAKLAKARKAADARIAKLPAPTPAISFAYEGDLIIQNLWAGETSVTARIARLGTQWVWRVTETSFLDWAGGEVHEKVMLHLGKDLRILSGTVERTEKGVTTSLGFSRSEKGFDVQRRIKKGEDWGKAETVVMKAPAGASGTLAAAVLFLRGLKPSKGGDYALPWIPNPSWKSPASAENTTLLRLTLEGEGTLVVGKKTFDTSKVRYATGGTAWTMHLSRDHRKIIGMVSATGPSRVVPRGMGGERITADPTQPATTWKRAFLKFGFGYHRAKRELLDEAFHWDAMYAHETKVLKRWSKDQPVKEFKKAWIQEFVNQSLHRDVPATRRLLAMTLATGKIKKQTDDEVVFWAHPNFGGGTQKTYHFARKDGVWAITRIDF